MTFWWQSRRELECKIAEINASRPQCPVGLNTLVLPSKNTLSDSDKQPYVYMACGHVHGQHAWGKGDDTHSRVCPMCRTKGPFTKVQTGQETGYYVDTGPPSCCFSPCAHLASEETVRWVLHAFLFCPCIYHSVFLFQILGFSTNSSWLPWFPSGLPILRHSSYRRSGLAKANFSRPRWLMF
jgi:hypothetical protein